MPIINTLDTSISDMLSSLLYTSYKPRYRHGEWISSRPVFDNKFQLDLAGIDPATVKVETRRGRVYVYVADSLVYEAEFYEGYDSVKASLRHGLLTVEAVPEPAQTIPVEIVK